MGWPAVNGAWTKYLQTLLFQITQTALEKGQEPYVI